MATPSAVVGFNTTITVTMAGNETGKVIIEVNGYNYTAPINGNEAVLVIGLPVGKYNATVYYEGDANYNATVNRTAAEFEVTGKTAPEVNITVEDFTVEIDNNITFTVDTNSNGNLTVKVNGVEVFAGADGKYHYNAAVAGNYTITAEVEGNDYYAPASNASDVITVYKHASDITSIVSTPKVFEGKNTTITVTMTNVSSGKVMIEVGGHNYTVEIKDYKATLVVALPVGNYTAKAYFLGDDKYNATEFENATAFEVAAKQNATVEIVAGTVVEIENNLTFTVNNDTPVVVTVNGVEITPVNGVYTFEANAAGNYTIVARSNETDEYLAGLDISRFTVLKHNATVAINVNATYHVDEAFEIGITNDTAAVVTINGKNYTVGGGKVTVPADELPAGHYIVTATIYESDKYVGNATSKEFDIIKYARW